jgi:hypothetical protein
MQTRKALVVGIDEYPQNPLHGCINDALAIKGLLEGNGDGSPNFDVKYSPNIGTHAELRTAIQKLFSGDSDIALLYFSGHGYYDKALGSYLVTPDLKEGSMGIPITDILTYANKSQCANKIIILDSCFSGSAGLIPALSSDASAISNGVTIMTASRSNEPSMEIGGHGVFTNLLIAALKGGAADVRGCITPGSIYAYVDQALGAWDQRPLFKTNVSQFVSVRTVAEHIPMQIIRELPLLFPSPDESLPLDPSYEYTNSPDDNHQVIEPYANRDHVLVFKKLQKLESAGLVLPVNEEHMYFAAMNSKSCCLTEIGKHYWRLANEKRL